MSAAARGLFSWSVPPSGANDAGPALTRVFRRFILRVMSKTLDALPGTPMRVADVAPALAKYWSEAMRSGNSSRASQMSVVVVFGVDVTPEEAAEKLENAFTFSHRYPCRIIALVPDASPDAKPEGRFHVACFADAKGRERRCGEVLMFGYPADFPTEQLESQLSVWLESDLPVYFWLHGTTVAEVAKLAPMFKVARRVVYDSSVCTGDFSKVAWPKPELVRDLANSRLLGVRQALGQFLAGYTPESLATGLTEVAVRHAKRRSGEAKNLSRWMRSGLEEVSRRTTIPLTANFTIEESEGGASCISTEWKYANGDRLVWQHSATSSGASVEADIAGRQYSRPMRIPFLDQPTSLAEAMLF